MHPKDIALFILLILGVLGVVIAWHVTRKRERQEVNRLLTEEHLNGVKYDKVFMMPKNSKYVYDGRRHFRKDFGYCLMKIGSNKFLHIIFFLFLLLCSLMFFSISKNKELSLLAVIGWIIVAIFVVIDFIYLIAIVMNQHICFYKRGLEIKTIFAKTTSYEYKDILSINLCRSDVPFIKLLDYLIITRDGKRHQIPSILFNKVKPKFAFWQEHLF